MPLYAQQPVLRTRQMAADLGMLAWVVLWVLVARTVHRARFRTLGPALSEGLPIFSSLSLQQCTVADRRARRWATPCTRADPSAR